MDVILPIFSQRLKQLRRDRKITQKAMAELLGKTERHYQAIEAGCINVPATQLIFLAKRGLPAGPLGPAVTRVRQDTVWNCFP